MTTLSRTCAALTVAAFAAITAGCSSSSTTTATSDGKPAYCAPLVEAMKLVPTPGQTSGEPVQAFIKALGPVADAASAGGKADVAAYFRSVAKFSDLTQPSGPGDLQALTDASAKIQPVVQTDCGFSVK